MKQAPSQPGSRPRVAVITKLSNANAGNEALSTCLLEFLGARVPEAEIRGIDRTWQLSRALARYKAESLKAQPDAALGLFDAMVEDFIRRFGRPARGALAPLVGAASVAAPSQPSRRPGLLAKVSGALRIRTRLAEAGLLGKAEARRAASSVAWADVVIWNAAGEFYPTADWDDALRLLIVFATAARLDARTAVVNHSIETSDPLLDRLIAHVYARASLVFVRGARSRTKARALGVGEDKLIETADFAFMLGGRASPSSREAVDGGSIVLALNGKVAHQAHDEWERLFDGLAALGRPLVFMSNSIADDAPFGRRWRGSHGVRVIERQHGFGEMLAMIAPAGAVVSSRLHTTLFALCSAVPVVAIEPADYKIREILEQMDYPLDALDPAQPDWADRVVDRVRRALADRSEYSRAAAVGVRRQQERIAAAYGPLVELIDRTRGRAARR